MKALVYPAFDQIEIQEIPVPSPDLWEHEVVLGKRKMGSYAMTSRDIPTAIGLFAHGKVELSPWVRPFPLTEGARVFRELLGQPSDYVKGVLLP